MTCKKDTAVEHILCLADHHYCLGLTIRLLDLLSMVQSNTQLGGRFEDIIPRLYAGVDIPFQQNGQTLGSLFPISC